MRSKAPEHLDGTAQQDREVSVHTPPAGKGKTAVAPGAKAPSVHDRIGKTPVKDRLHDTCGHVDDGDTRYVGGGRKYTP